MQEIFDHFTPVITLEDIQKSLDALMLDQQNIGLVIRWIKKIIYPDPFHPIQPKTHQQKVFFALLKQHIHEINAKNTHCAAQKLTFTKHSINKITLHDETHLLPDPSLLSYSEHLDFCLKNINPLISPKQKYHLLALSKKIPAIYSTETTILEFRLDNAESVDLSIAIPRKMLWSLLEQSHKKSLDAIHRLLKRCAEINKKELLVFPEFFEFDVNGTVNDIQPNIFLTFHPMLSHSAHPHNFMTLLQKIFCPQIDEGTLSFFKRCLTHLPSGHHITHVGHMLARNEVVYKIVIFNFSILKIIDFLTAIAWQGDYEAIRQLLKRLPADQYKIALSLDIMQGNNSKLGLEISPTPHNKERFKPLFNTLVDMNLCSTDKATSLLHAEWLYFDKYFKFYTAHLIHVKISLQDNTLSAKAYLSYLTSAAWSRPFLLESYL